MLNSEVAGLLVYLVLQRTGRLTALPVPEGLPRVAR